MGLVQMQEISVQGCGGTIQWAGSHDLYIMCQGMYSNKVQQPESLSYFHNIFYLYIIILTIYCIITVVRELMAHEGLATLHKVTRISCTFMTHGKISEFDSVVTPNFIQLAWLTLFSVMWQIFHSPTAQASESLLQKCSHTYQWP